MKLAGARQRRGRRAAGLLATASGRRPAVRRAFTLLEMIVVLGLLTAVLSLAWPAVRHTLAKSQLREAAKQVRNQLTRARLSAIESGMAQQFRFQPGTGRFVVTPLAAVTTATANPTIRASAPVAAPAEPDASVQDLGDGVVFATDDLQAAYGYSAEAASELEVPPPAAPIAAEELELDDRWSKPIVFYPNGRSSTANVRLHSDRDFSVDIRLRGVMGTVEVAGPQRVRDGEVRR